MNVYLIIEFQGRIQCKCDLKSTQNYLVGDYSVKWIYAAIPDAIRFLHILLHLFRKNSFWKSPPSLKLRRIIEELQPLPSRNPSRFYSRFPRCYKGQKIKKRSKMTSCLLWLPRLPEYSGEPATHGLIPSTRDCSNQLLSFSSPSNMKDHPSIL